MTGLLARIFGIGRPGGVLDVAIRRVHVPETCGLGL